MVKELYHTLQKDCPEVSDLTAKAISTQGVSMDINIPHVTLDHQPTSTSKVVSPPGVKVSVLIP